MDTPDRAAGLADPDLTEAVNRDHLLASISLSQSGGYSWARGRRHHDFSLSASSHFDRKTHYGTSSSQMNRCRETGYHNNGNVEADQTSRLLHNYKSNRVTEQVRGNINNHSSNINLYDNICFNELPPPFTPPLLGNIGTHRHGPTADEDCCHRQFDESNRILDPTGGFCCFGRFRIFLACYLLLGVTLAIYSRNALSLAAVKMVANNEINNGLFALFSSINTSNSQNEPTSLDDGSCPIKTLHINQHHSAAPQETNGAILNTNQSLLNSAYENQVTRLYLADNLKASIKYRVRGGELVDWSPSEQGIIFAAGSVGNLLMAIPLSRLGEIYGAKWIIFVSVLGATLQAALMPTVSTYHVSLVVLFQVIFNGLTFGADCVAYTLFAHWLTPTEMSFFVACLMTCYQLGTILSTFITSELLVAGVNWHWCFYTPAILCGLWTLFWALLAASDPSKSRLISKSELSFLQRRSKIAQMIHDLEKANGGDKKCRPSAGAADAHLPIDWVKLSKDPNIWALIAVKFSLRWFFSVYASLMPTYLSSVLHLSVGLIGKVSVIKSGIGLALGILISYMTKSVINRRPFNLSLATFRKVFQSIVSFGLSLSLLVILLVDCNQWVTIISLTLNGICINFYVAAALQVPLDLSPNHCGLITSITTTLALGQAIGAPISGLILNNGPANRALWRIVWLVSILLNTFSGLLFIALIDSKPKDYNKYPTLPDNADCEGAKRKGSCTKIN